MSFVHGFLGSISRRVRGLLLRLPLATMTLLIYLSLSALWLWKCLVGKRECPQSLDGISYYGWAEGLEKQLSALHTPYTKRLLMTFPDAVLVTYHTSLQ